MSFVLILNFSFFAFSKPSNTLNIELNTSTNPHKLNIEGVDFSLKFLPKGTWLFHWGEESFVKEIAQRGFRQNDVDYLTEHSRGSYGGGMYFSTIADRYKGTKISKVKPLRHQLAVRLEHDLYFFDLDQVERALRIPMKDPMFRFSKEHRLRFKELGLAAESFVNEYIVWDHKSLGKVYNGGKQGLSVDQLEQLFGNVCENIIKRTKK